MASIRKRKGRFQARVTRSGYPEQLKTFHKREDAERWGRQVEYDLDNHNLKFPPSEVKALTLRKLILKYMKKVLPFKRYPAVAKNYSVDEAVCHNYICLLDAKMNFSDLRAEPIWFEKTIIDLNFEEMVF